MPIKVIRDGNAHRVDVYARGTRVRLDIQGPLQTAQWAENSIRARLQDGHPIDKEQIKAEALAATGVEAVQGTRTLQDLYKETVRFHWKGQKSERTHCINAESVIREIGPNRRVLDITPRVIQEALASLVAQGNSPATVNRKRSALSKMLEVALLSGWIKSKPKFPPMKKEATHRIRFLSEQEEKAILSMAQRLSMDDVADLILVMLYTGARSAEARYLKCVDVDDRHVHYRDTKSHTDRSVPLCRTAAQVLHRRKRLATGDRIFPTVTKETLRYQWNRIKANLGYAEDPQFIPHICRHTFASRMVQRGVPLKAVQELMGHSDIKTTMRYSHLAPGHLDAAVNVLDTPETSHNPLRAVQ